MKTSPLSFASFLLAIFVLLCMSSVMADESVEGMPPHPPATVDCEAYCAPQIASIISTCEMSKAEMQASTDKLLTKYGEAMDKLSFITTENDRLEADLDEMRSVESRLTDIGHELQASLAQATKEAQDTWTINKSHENTIKALEKELAMVRDEMVSYRDARIIINWDLLRSDGMALLRKIGIVKSEEL